MYLIKSKANVMQNRILDHQDSHLSCSLMFYSVPFFAFKMYFTVEFRWFNFHSYKIPSIIEICDKALRTNLGSLSKSLKNTMENTETCKSI